MKKKVKNQHNSYKKNCTLELRILVHLKNINQVIQSNKTEENNRKDTIKNQFMINLLEVQEEMMQEEEENTKQILGQV